MRTRCAGHPMAVCLEPARGPLLSALWPSACLLLAPLTPATLAKYRDAFAPRRAQDAPQAADALLEVLLPHRDRRTAGRPAHATTRTRHELGEPRRRLVHAHTRRRTRRTALLQASCPQDFQGVADIRTPLGGAVVLRWPTLAAVPQGRPATRAQVLREPNSVRHETRAHRRAARKAAGPWTTVQAGRPAAVLLRQARATPRQPTSAALRALDAAMAPLGRRQAASPLCAALPGAGPGSAARLTAAMGTASNRGTTGEKCRCFSGGAPVLGRSGKATWMRWRSCGPQCLRPACHA